MSRFELPSHSPLWNAAGTLGFAPPRRGTVDVSRFGAFVTNPISLHARTPAQLPRLLHFPGGVLLHTGLPNPGLRSVLRQYASHWARSPIPVIVHLMAESPEDVSQMVRQLEEVEGVAGVELGLPPDVTPAQVVELTQAGSGELPLIVRLPLAWDLPNLPPAAVSFGPPRGALPGNRAGSFVEGRLFGPGLFPQVLHAVREWKHADIPLIAGGGVYHPAQAEALLAAGASAVQLDLLLWRGLWPNQEWENWLVSAPSKWSLAHR